MAIKDDGLHYDYTKIDGYNKAFNFIMSSRELGKTAMFWFKKAYKKWKINKKPWIYLVRKSVEITETLITSIADTIINKFTDDNVEFQYNKGTFKDGITDVKINGEVFFRIVSLSIDLRRIKLAVLKNVAGVFMDEYIIDPRTDEKYQTNEAFKIKEAYTTWRREADGILKFYIAGNPYSFYNPLFVDWKVDVSNLRKDEFYVGEIFVIHWCSLNPQLRAKILEFNPLYTFDEDYSGYALEGQAINDRNIKVVPNLPHNYSLRFVFKHNNRYIGVWRNNNWIESEDKFYCKFESEISARRTIYCFEFAELVDRSIVMSIDERQKVQRFKEAFRKREIAFSDVNCYYFIEEIYKNI